MTTLAQQFAQLEQAMRQRGTLIRQPDPSPAAAICGLTVREPWATLICRSAEWNGRGKEIECRGWETSFRGPLLIHSAKWWSAAHVEETLNALRCEGLIGGEFPEVDLDECQRNTGHVIARAELIRCRELHHDDPDPWCRPSRAAVESGKAIARCFAWELRSIERVEPRFAKGAQGLWQAPVDLCASLRAATTPTKAVALSSTRHVAPAAATRLLSLDRGESDPLQGLTATPIAATAVAALAVVVVAIRQVEDELGVSILPAPAPEQSFEGRSKAEFLRVQARARDDWRALGSLSKVADTLCRAVVHSGLRDAGHEVGADWRVVANLVEHAIGRIEMGEWQIGGWIPLPGWQQYATAPEPLRELLDFYCSLVRERRIHWKDTAESDPDAIAAGVHQFDEHADERAEALIERCGL